MTAEEITIRLSTIKSALRAAIEADLDDGWILDCKLAMAAVGALDAALEEMRKDTERLREAELVITAARCIRHWHDTGRNDEGMIVSASHVRALWQALSVYDGEAPAEQQDTGAIALKPTPPNPATFFNVWRCSSCGEAQCYSSSPSGWRWTGDAWEHKCGDPQAGYFPARDFGSVSAERQDTGSTPVVRENRTTECACRRTLEEAQRKLASITAAWEKRQTYGQGTAAFLSVETTFGDIREAAETEYLIRDALATPCQKWSDYASTDAGRFDYALSEIAQLKAELKQIEDEVGFYGNPGDIVTVIRKTREYAHKLKDELAEAVKALEPFAEEWRRRREPEDDIPFAAARAIVNKHQEPKS